MDLAAFNNELNNDPAELGYAGKTDAELVTLLTTKNRSKLVEYRLTELGIYNLLSANPVAAETFIATLEAFSESADPAAPLVKRMLPWTGPGAPGLDFGNAALLAVLDGLVAASVLSGDTVNTIKAQATKAICRLEEINCDDAATDHKMLLHEIYAMGFGGRNPAEAPSKV